MVANSIRKSDKEQHKSCINPVLSEPESVNPVAFGMATIQWSFAILSAIGLKEKDELCHKKTVWALGQLIVQISMCICAVSKEPSVLCGKPGIIE